MAIGAQLRHLVSGRVKVFVSDGAEYAAWQVGPRKPMVLLDTRTGRRRDIALPAGCRLDERTREGQAIEAAADGRFLLTCNIGADLLDVVTGKVTPLPRSHAWQNVGDYYVTSAKAAYDIATGAVTKVGKQADPNAPDDSLDAVCRGLRARVERYGHNTLEGLAGVAYTNTLFAHADGDQGAVRIEYCRRKPTTLQPIKNEPSAAALDLRGGLLTWDTAAEEEERRAQPYSGTLYSYDPGSGKREHWRLPLAPGVFTEEKGAFGYSTHTSNMVFWLAEAGSEEGRGAGVNEWRIYAARR